MPISIDECPFGSRCWVGFGKPLKNFLAYGYRYRTGIAAASVTLMAASVLSSSLSYRRFFRSNRPCWFKIPYVDRIGASWAILSFYHNFNNIFYLKNLSVLISISVLAIFSSDFCDFRRLLRSVSPFLTVVLGI